MKLIYVLTTGKLHPFLKDIILNPPKGYAFIYKKNVYDSILKNKFIYYNILFRVAAFAPIKLFKSIFDYFSLKLTEGMSLIFTWDLLIFQKIPWIIYLEQTSHPVAPEYFRTFYMYRLGLKTIAEKVLSSDYCKKIVVPSECIKREILSTLNCQKFIQKIDIIYPTVSFKHIKNKNFKKSAYENKASEIVKILFLGSQHYPADFLTSGGIEALAAFAKVSTNFKNIELICRSKVPARIKQKYQSLTNIKWVEEPLDQQSLQRLFMSCDIFLAPYLTTFWLRPIEAMSYGLPIIITDIYANSEYVKDGKNGFLVNPPKNICFYHKNGMIYFDRRILNEGREPDRETVKQLVDKLSILIEDPELRKRMGRAGRREVEYGKFSVERRNRMLESMLKESIERGI